MSRLSGLGQPRGMGQIGGRGKPRRLVAPARKAAGRRAMKTSTSIVLITVGSILLFALRSGSPRWIDLHVVGLILILAGALGVLLPWLAGPPGDRFRRWVVPLLPPSDHEQPPRDTQAGGGNGPLLVRESGVNGDRPTLADELLSFEHDPPV